MENKISAEGFEWQIFPEISGTDSEKEVFFKKHNIIACPECGGELEFAGYDEVGERGKVVCEGASQSTSEYTLYLGNADGKRLNGRFDCKRCGFAFEKQSYSEYRYGSRFDNCFKNTLIGYRPISECSERTKELMAELCRDWLHEKLKRP